LQGKIAGLSPSAAAIFADYTECQHGLTTQNIAVLLGAQWRKLREEDDG
jgi:hypothetical protein